MTIYLNDQSAHYDLDMEIACSIPRKSIGASLSLLALDFGYDSQREVRSALSRLGQRFAGVEVRSNLASQSGRVAWCTRLGWEKLRCACQKYWDQVYPASEQPAEPVMGGYTIGEDYTN